MLCEKILGNLKEESFRGMQTVYVDFRWDEVFKRVHRKTAGDGTELGIRLDDSVLCKGIGQDDVLAVEGKTAYAVNILPCRALVIEPDSAHSNVGEKVCYEIGNRHAPLFFGEENTLVTPYNGPMEKLLEKIHGVRVRTEEVKLDFDRRISASVSSHTH